MGLKDSRWITPAAGATPKDKCDKGLEMTLMKNWKKLVAMLLAGVMALAMLTACGGVEMYDETEDLAAEKKVRTAMQETYGSDFNFKHNGNLKDLAWKTLNEVTINDGNVDKKFELNVDKNGIAIVHVKSDLTVDSGDENVNVGSSTVIDSKKLADWMEKNNMFNDKLLDLNVGKWVNVGVVAKNVNGKIYVAVAVGVNWGK